VSGTIALGSSRAPVLDIPYRHMNGYMSQAALAGKKRGSTQQAAFIASATRQARVFPRRFATKVHNGAHKIPVTELTG